MTTVASPTQETIFDGDWRFTCRDTDLNRVGRGTAQRERVVAEPIAPFGGRDGLVSAECLNRERG
jgi:hypothetical protein